MLCKLHSISYNLSYIYIYIVKCFRKISQKFLFHAENQTMHSENRAALGENGWNSLDFIAFPLDFAGFQRVTPRFLLISSEIHWILQVRRRFRVDFSRFRREHPRSPWFISGRENPRKKPAWKRRIEKSRNPPPRWPCGCRGLAAFLYSRSTRKIMSVQFSLNVYFQGLVSATKLARIVQIIKEFSRYCVPLRVKNFWCIIYLESEGGVRLPKPLSIK